MCHNSTFDTDIYLFRWNTATLPSMGVFYESESGIFDLIFVKIVGSKFGCRILTWIYDKANQSIEYCFKTL